MLVLRKKKMLNALLILVRDPSEISHRKKILRMGPPITIKHAQAPPPYPLGHIYGLLYPFVPFVLGCGRHKQVHKHTDKQGLARLAGSGG